MIVVDASVFAKLFLDEPDRPEAEALFAHVAERDVELVAPSLIVYEALPIGLRHAVPFKRSPRQATGTRVIRPFRTVSTTPWP